MVTWNSRVLSELAAAERIPKWRISCSPINWVRMKWRGKQPAAPTEVPNCDEESEPPGLVCPFSDMHCHYLRSGLFRDHDWSRHRPVVARPQAQQAVQSSSLRRENYEGIVTDTHCGAKHSAAVGLSAADCTRACVHSGEGFALVDGEKTYRLKGDEAALKRVAGERVKLTGTLTDNTISVGSVSRLSPLRLAGFALDQRGWHRRYLAYRSRNYRGRGLDRGTRPGQRPVHPICQRSFFPQ